VSGFTIYETLRIFIPGGMTLLIVDLSLRLATGTPESDVAPGWPSDISSAIESGTGFVALSVVVGLFLYMIDLPERLRVVAGDPTRGYERPSAVFSEMLRVHNSTFGNRKYGDEMALSLFFAIIDKYMPEELHKRIYLFGALFKIFADLRAVLTAALLLGVPASIAYGTTDGRGVHDLSLNAQASISVFIVLLALLALGIAGHLRFRMDLHRYERKSGQTVAAGPGASQLAFPMLLLAVLGTSAVALATNLAGPAGYSGVVVGALAWALWFSLETGPPEPGKTFGWRRFGEWNPVHHGLRSQLLSLLGIKETEAPQLPILYRTFTDLAVYAPMLVGASIGAVFLDRRPTAVLGWGVIPVLAVLIMSNRKHERRQLNVYHDQAAFLKVSQEGITGVLNGAKGLPDTMP
jgi:hypothetical protein